MLGLLERDFDAYLPERASSNAYSRPRLEFKQRAVGWARNVTSRLQALGVSVDVHASDEHPSVWNGHRVDCQWIFFWREAATRSDIDALLDQRIGLAHTLREPSPYRRHTLLALRLDASGIEVSVQLHPDAWVDFETAKARLADPVASKRLVDAIQELPEQFAVGLFGLSHDPTSLTTTESLRALLDRSKDDSVALWIGWRVSRDVAVEHAAILDDQLEDAIVALAPVYRLTSWSPQDDPASISSRLAAMRQEQERVLSERAEQEERLRAENDRQRKEANERSRERTRERINYGIPKTRPTLGGLFRSSESSSTSVKTPHQVGSRKQRQLVDETSALLERSIPTDSEPKTAKDDARDRVERDRPATPSAELSESLDKGTRVQVLSGPFAGKVGVIGDMDGRGGARVLLGLLATRVPIAELAAVVESSERPALQSSHRRPGPAGRCPR